MFIDAEDDPDAQGTSSGAVDAAGLHRPRSHRTAPPVAPELLAIGALGYPRKV